MASDGSSLNDPRRAREEVRLRGSAFAAVVAGGTAVLAVLLGLGVAMNKLSPLVFLVVAPLFVLYLAIALFVFRSVPRRILVGEYGLTLEFFRDTHPVSWDNVEWYTRLGTLSRPTDIDTVHVNVLMKYRKTRAETHIAYIALSGRRAPSGDLFLTVLDEKVAGARVPVLSWVRRAIGRVARLILAMMLCGAAAGTADSSVIEPLVNGTTSSVVERFRYFEKQRGEGAVRADRMAVETFFELLSVHFGQLRPMGRIEQTSTVFVHAYVESATPDLWRTTRDCDFATVAHRAEFDKNSETTPAEVVVEMCRTRDRRAWVKRVEVRFIGPEVLSRGV